MGKKTLQGKEVILGICGGIAAYKVCDLINKLRNEGASATCILTENAAKFITPLTLQTLSTNQVYQDMFENAVWDVEHIALAQKADLVVVIPATADTISKLAFGRAEDLLSSVVLATLAPILICPAMNENMWLHPATKKNLQTVKSYKYRILEPRKGRLACGLVGIGCLAELDSILNEIKKILL
jgi:phosphopantothenoylcysteine synthetase/decarboxylase